MSDGNDTGDRDERRPNVLFVFGDQHRASALSCAGNEQIHTPNFDRLAETGVRSSNAYSNHPVCGPGRACLISGQYRHTNGVVANDLPLPTAVPSVAEAFRDAGYRTGYVGKWHLDGVPRDKFTPPGPRRQGFDDFWRVFNCAHDYFEGRYYGEDGDLHRIDGYEPAGQTDLALEFLDGAAGDDRPFCLFLSWGPPHDPYRLVPEEHRERYDPDELRMPPNAQPLIPGGLAGGTPNAPPVKEWGETCSPWTYGADDHYDYERPEEALADYYAAVTALDEQFGRLIDGLDERGLGDDTILAYTADHGDLLYSQGDNQKSTPHEEAANVPFVVRWSDEIPAGEETDALIGLVDVAPTLLGLAGVEIPETMEGTNCAPAFSDPGVAAQESLFLSGGRWRAVRTERYTYARVLTSHQDYEHVHGGAWFLFDTEEDPYQLRNRVYDPDYRSVRADLDDRLNRYLNDLDDPGLPTRELAAELDRVEEWNERVRYFHEHDEESFGELLPEG